MSTILGDAFDKQIEIVVKQATDRNESLSSASQQLVSDWDALLRSIVELYQRLDRAKRDVVQSAAERGSVSAAECGNLAGMYQRVVECSRGLLAASESYRALLNPDTLAALEYYQRSAIGFLESERICESQENVVVSSRDAALIDRLLKS